MVIWGFAGQSYHSIHYILIYIAGSFTIYYFIHNFCVQPRNFQAEHYKSLSGTMEIQGQLTQVISGAAASFLVKLCL